MGSPSGPMGGGGVGCLPHEGHPAKDPLSDWVLVVDDIHERRLACLHNQPTIILVMNFRRSS